VTYFALGDSISIDEYAGGPGLGAASLLADDLGIDLTLLARDATSCGSSSTRSSAGPRSSP
jgi:hypothetical protein